MPAKKKPTKKQIEASHERSYAELHKMAKEHNNKVIGIGKTKVFSNGIYSLHDVGSSRQLEGHADVMKELGKIDSYRIVKGGKYGDELWVK